MARFVEAIQDAVGQLAALNLSARFSASQKDGGRELYHDNGATGAAVTVDMSNGNYQRIQLTAATVTVSFAGIGSTDETSETIGGSFMLIVDQDGTGGRLVTWPGSAQWPSGTAPTLST
ncbi:MAG: hypothetical protein GY925_16085, partial [Actinomycetia bacterium]|nr:hypothetical protein [Actinomycetes bacterium]